MTYTRIPSPYDGDHPSLWRTGYRVERGGVTIGYVHSAVVETERPGTSRIRIVAGHPTRWFANLVHPRLGAEHPTAGESVGYRFYSRAEAADALVRAVTP